MASGVATSLASNGVIHQQQPSQFQQNTTSENLTTSLLESVQGVAERAEAEGRDPNEVELRRVVGQTVLEGILAGYKMTEEDASPQSNGAKRSRID
jgi:uncharacterized protein